MVRNSGIRISPSWLYIFFPDTYIKVHSLHHFKKQPFDGYLCDECNVAILDLKRHYNNKHKDIKVDDWNTLLNDTKINKKKKLDYLIEDFGKRLKEGIFARQTTSEKDNKAQIRILTRAFQNGAFHDYRLLQNNIGNKETKFGTKYSYLTTVKNFLKYLETYHKEFYPEDQRKLRVTVEEWMKRIKPKTRKESMYIWWTFP